MQFVVLAMLVMIAGSIVLELVVPQSVKNRLGTAICWGMMALTMTFLGASTIGLLVATFTMFIRPRLGG
jgi:hypothetical protein